MSVYGKSGTELNVVYDTQGISLSEAFDIDGLQVFGGTTPTPPPSEDDYNEYSNQYQYQILQARNAWASAYRADSDAVPFVASTDQHGWLTVSRGGKALYDYLGLAVNWTECSASMNLGDVCGAAYTESSLNQMQTTFANIPSAKQINIAGNHDVYDLQLDSDAMDTMFDTYFNNSSYSNCTRFEHRGFETMIDTVHKVRYVNIGTWYYNTQVTYDHRISPDAISWLINVLSSVDNYDIVILSHIAPFARSVGHNYNDQFVFIYPAVDGDTLKCAKQVKSEPTHFKITIDEIISARKNKTSGTFTDGDDETHSYDFISCTSDVLCTIDGHYHQDWYTYCTGVPSISLDAYGYDDHPFYFGLIDRTNEYVKFWKVGRTETYVYTVPFEEHVNPCTAIALDQSTVTISVGETITLTPTFSTENQDDGRYPEWFAVWRSFTASVATVQDGVVTGVSAGTATIRASCGTLYDECVVTVVEA